MSAIALMGVDTAEKFEKLTKKPYKKQAVWFLNAFWEEYFQDEAAREKIWEYCNLMVKLDPKGENGNELDEFKAHQFLEKTEGAKTVAQMRKELKEIDIDFNKYVALTEFFVFNYKCDVKALVNAPQTSDSESSKALTKAQQEVDLAMAKAQAAAQTADEAQKAADNSAKCAAEAKAALDELHAQQKAYDDKCASLEKTGSDMSLGIVKRNRAKQELAMLKAKDPLPLDRAKINQGATVRKAERARKKADKAAAAAKESKEAAEKAFKDAEAELARLTKASKGAGQGTLWYMKRELQEAKKYMTPKQLKKSDSFLLAKMQGMGV